ncbi:DUF3108 domain-containing protein [Trinickia sp. NRRL B-1857]|uniref:DUF3108 domain-containing protein n=1 Tax=Trinickia sp. NRRL B-1857 TaxID=3162879 RepID=UPI003D297469
MSSLPHLAAGRAVPASRGTSRRAWRWGVALAAAVALHGISAIWFVKHRAAFEPETPKPPVQVALLTPQPIARGDSVRQRPAARTEPAPARPSTPSGPAPVLHALTPSPTASVRREAARASTTEAAASPTLAASAPGTDSIDETGSTVGNKPAPGLKFSVPPSGDLHYNTFYNGVENAPGTIRWSSDRESYDMLVSVPLPFVGTFTYESRGRIDAFGLAPEHYVEKRGRRPEQVTTFDRTDKRIGFTRTSATLALPDGAQDRFSMVMQLASLVRGDPETYKPGVTRSFYVADDDSGELWPIETIGDESIRTAEGFLDTRHFMRLPRHDGDRRRIDVWLAPSLGWLPARIMQTEPNGSQIELVWRGPLRPPGSENATSMAKTPDDSSDASATEVGPAREHP